MQSPKVNMRNNDFTRGAKSSAKETVLEKRIIHSVNSRNREKYIFFQTKNKKENLECVTKIWTELTLEYFFASLQFLSGCALSFTTAFRR